MGCPLLGYLPELTEIAGRLKKWQDKPSIGLFLNYLCMACRARSKDGRCPLGEDFGCELRQRMPFLKDVVEQTVREKRRKGYG